MRVVSVNVGLPRRVVNGAGNVRDGRREVATAIFKQPVSGRVAVRRLNLDGDRQADLSVHGGPEKAVYAYPAEHYPYWREQFPDRELPWAQFGENLTTEGLLEDAIHIGDRFRVGGAELVVTQPRMPCFKLGIRFGRPDMVKRFLASRRTGFYFAVAIEGEVAVGDAIIPLARHPAGVRVADVTRLYAARRDRSAATRAEMRHLAELEALPAIWRDYFRERAARG